MKSNIISFVLGFLTCAILGIVAVANGWDDNLKKDFIAWQAENAASSDLANEKWTSLPDDPAKDPRTNSSGPRDEYVFVEYSNAPNNTDKFMRRAYIYGTDSSLALYVLTLKPGELFDESWVNWNYSTISNVTWIDNDHIGFLANGRACTASISQDYVQCD